MASHVRRLLWSLLVALPAVALGSAAQAQQTTVTGRVTARESGEALTDVRVIVLGTSLFTVTNAEGRYTLRGVPAGTHTIRTIRVGFVEQKKPVTVVAGQSVALDFMLDPAVVVLQQVVTTATGAQRRVELGNAVATVEVASKVESAPVKNFGDLLTAKAAGVQVIPGTMTGAGARVRIRGTSSLSLTNDPIYVIDGVRMMSQSNCNGCIGVGGTIPSRVNDINPDEIESIEVVKGPSAATLYGTDAANGVIVINTKKGRAGRAVWSVFGERGIVDDNNDYPTVYAILGHAPATPTTARRCFLTQIADGSCIKDSTTSLNIFSDPETSPIKAGWRTQAGAQVSGGSDAIRYFISGDLENEVGPFALPEMSVRRLDSIGTKIRDEWDRPNALDKQSYRGNINAAVNPKLDMSVQSNFIKLRQRLPQVDNNVNSFFYNGTVGPGFKTAGPGYTGIGTLGQPLRGWAGFTPAEIFQTETSQDVHRFLGSSNIDWRPISFLQTRADVGVDFTGRNDFRLCRFAQCADFGTNRLGAARDVRSNLRSITANLHATANFSPRAWLGLKTTGGVQYVDYNENRNDAQGSQLPPGAQTPADGTIPLVGSETVLQKTFGIFAEEQAALNDRLFLTAAVRTDQNSAFGTNFQRVFYPKFALSWIMSDEGFFPKLGWLGEFRLRSSYGESGVQPGPNDAARSLEAIVTNIGNLDVGGLRSNRLGNAELRPENSKEFEVGFDTRMFGDRVNFEATYYRKTSEDALINQTIAPSAGTQVTNIRRNLGAIRNSGYEGLVTTQILSKRNLAWDLSISASHNSNKLLTLGVDAAGRTVPPIIGATIRQVPGYPVNGAWLRKYSWSDANKDGLIAVSEVKVDTGFTFAGYTQPRLELTFTNGLDLLNHRIRLQALIDHKSGYRLSNTEQSFLCQQSVGCNDISNPNAPLWRQARAVANRFVPVVTPEGYFEDMNWWRIREVSLIYQLHSRVAELLRSSGGNITFAARNLKVFTDYTGVDPEANYGQSDTQNTLLTAGPPSYFTLRLNLRY
ncbi:MAG TPA: SusC/RagA family TonB-linked outer membrane protein [Gemmatimonadaceae bacterium]|nr:SusC/RagA family TonB-linked outer membrane protein [Gemmatimonadaceae bacterium]